ncbi:MAG TPA: cysteine dioxygenase family protein, partial [Gaiellaceae bacterium]|nr:cysteine dioxygenase family protein [Gaiellaceae bacterium]
MASRAGFVLASALADPHLLEPRHQEPWPDRYRPHLVHVHPEGLYSVVALVWRPGQATAIHDHRCWCVVGVWQGSEQETTYDLYRDGSGPYLVERACACSSPGVVSVLVPPDEDVHRVANCGNELAISIHLYGDDIGLHGSSINRTFGDELVRPDAGSGGTASWRSLDAQRPLAAGRGYNSGVRDIRGRHGFDVVGSPGELQAEVSGRPPKTTGTKRKCGEQPRTRCLVTS